MGILTFTPHLTDTTPQPKKQNHHQRQHESPKRRRKHQPQKPVQPPKPKPKSKSKPKQASSWEQLKNLLTCKQVEGTRVHDPSKRPLTSNVAQPGSYSKLSSSCGSMCSFRDVVHGNTSRVIHRSDNSSPESSSLGQEARLLGRSKTGCNKNGSASSRSMSGSVRSAASSTTTQSVSSRGMPLRKLSGCYECHMIVDPSRYPVIPRTRICACPHCGEIFSKIESLEQHQAVRHGVSELGSEDSGRNIVEIIFKSSWLKKEDPICKIERILKVENTQGTIQRFEDCRDAVKLRANNNTKKNPRCAADGNELLRFYCTTLTCSLGARGSTNLCSSTPACAVCSIIRHGFQGNKGVRTTASSGKAHDSMECPDGRRAMLVCRVIAGRVKPNPSDAPLGEIDSLGSYDSVAGSAGLYSNLEDLVVYNPRAILPCFVVIYKTAAII